MVIKAIQEITQEIEQTWNEVREQLNIFELEEATEEDEEEAVLIEEYY